MHDLTQLCMVYLVSFGTNDFTFKISKFNVHKFDHYLRPILINRAQLPGIKQQTVRVNMHYFIKVNCTNFKNWTQVKKSDTALKGISWWTILRTFYFYKMIL